MSRMCKAGFGPPTRARQRGVTLFGLMFWAVSIGIVAYMLAVSYTHLVLNKMDLPQADPDNAKSEIEDVIGIDAEHAIPCSAKTGMGLDEILEAVIARMPAPRGKPDGPPRAMIVDSWFDNYVGVVMLVRVVDGSLSKGERIRMMATNTVYGIEQMGVFTPKSVPRDTLKAGEVGFVCLLYPSRCV